MVAAPLGSVRTVPWFGQRSSVVRYWTLAYTSTLAAGWPSRTRRTMMLSDVNCGGFCAETETVEPAKRSVNAGTGGVGCAGGAVGATVGTAVAAGAAAAAAGLARALVVAAGTGVAVPSTVSRRGPVVSARTLDKTLRPERLIATRSMMTAPTSTDRATTAMTTSTSGRPAVRVCTIWRGRRRRVARPEPLAMCWLPWG